MKQCYPARLAAVIKWIIPLLLLACQPSCRKEQTFSRPLSGTFLIKEVPPNPDFTYAETYDTDSISTPEVEFIANEPDSDGIIYQWHIGTDTRAFTKRKFTLDFAGTSEESINVSLFVVKKDATDPSKNDTAFSHRTFYLRRRPFVTGTFEGYFQNNPQKVTLKIQDDFIYPAYYTGYDPEYKGLLITTSLRLYDSLFISSAWSAYQFLHRKLYLRKTPEVNFTLNKRLMQPRGLVTVNIDTRELVMDIQATSVNDNSSITLKFTGMKRD